MSKLYSMIKFIELGEDNFYEHILDLNKKQKLKFIGLKKDGRLD